MSSETILSKLNPSQRAAVTSSAHTLTILAGPGSGKTHTLTARTAYLLRHEGLQPWNVIVATFTVKAAREMKERIGKLIGDGMESKLILGTFHSIARRYLARYGHLIGIKKEFGIADSSDSLAIIKRIVKRHKLTIDPAAARSRISSRKAKGGQAVPRKSAHQSAEKSLEIQEIETCYAEYEESLRRSNLLDYDDLLLRCVDLLQEYPTCVSNVEAVLIDEFQDTNIVQFDLMRLFAVGRKRVTVVGDPDQSIYGWRSAETKNFKRMVLQYPETVTIPLEENYRSSGAILLSALELIQQDKGRIEKPLMPTHIIGTRPVLRKLRSTYSEAQWIVSEMKRVITLTGDLMTFDDIAILIRSASLSRLIEAALGKEGIPYRMVGGKKFFERVEIQIILDYLRVIDLPENNDALARVINVPSRRIGDTSVKELLNEADKIGITLWKLIFDKVQGIKNTNVKLSKQAEQGLSSFVNIILTARKKLSAQVEAKPSTKDLIDHIINKISFEDYLEKKYPTEYESRLANVQELINQASDFSGIAEDSENDEALPEVQGLPQECLSTALSKFLANIALASAIEASDANGPPKTEVTISTIHAAKGLEWPVVFIPATYDGCIPHSRAEDDNEERRLLYVAMTRAKALLYMSYPYKNSQSENTTLSPFLSPLSLKAQLDDRGPSFSPSVIQSIAQILRRPIPHVDFGAAASGLESLEDNIFATGDDETDDNWSKWQNWDGDHHYTQGQQVPKRQCIQSGRVDATAPRVQRRAYTTTMTQFASSSTMSTTLSSGFISARSHMKVFSVQSDTYACESLKSTTSVLESHIEPADKDGGPRTVKAPTARRLGGRGTLISFFSPSTTVPSQTQKTILMSNPSRDVCVDIAGKTITKCVPTQTNHLPSTPLVSDFAVHPSLGNHRLGCGQLMIPTRKQHEEDGLKKNDYVFLSSSPRAPDALVRSTEGSALDELPEPESPVKQVANPLFSRPAKTMHVTSMAKMSAIVPRKTLGVRRSMNGWQNRSSQAFAPPSMHRPP